MFLAITILCFLWVGCDGNGTHHNTSNSPPDGSGYPVPDWENIKNNALPSVALPDEYGTPHIQPHSSLAWEDGVFLSRDGLHMYAFYAPVDLLRYIEFATNNPGCNDTEDLSLFLRGPLLTMDLTTNPWGCPMVIHSDIAYSSRSSILEEFRSWEIAQISTSYRYEGGFHLLDNLDNTIDIVYSRSTESSKNDLFWARGVSHNPPFGTEQAMPTPINTQEQEDNPHLERIDTSTLVLLFDNHGVGDPSTRIKHSLSIDNGVSWSDPLELGANINHGSHDMQGHLYYDGSVYWIYFVSDRDGRLAIFRSKHNDSLHIKTNFDDWANAELVISPGDIRDNSGFIAGLGEPTLTEEGDISFVVVYGTHEEDNPYDRFEIDPWYLPRKR